MVDISSIGSIAKLKAPSPTQGAKTEEAQKPGETFLDVLTAMGKEAVESSKAADYASSPQGVQELSQLERAQLMQEASLSLEEFKRALEVTKSSVEGIMNTPL